MSMSTGGEGGHASGARDDRMSRNRCWGGESAAASVPPAVCGSAALKEVMAVKHVGPGGRAASARGKWSLAGLLLGERGWWAVTEKVVKLRAAVMGVTS
jgi:hypothetical protein